MQIDHDSFRSSVRHSNATDGKRALRPDRVRWRHDTPRRRVRSRPRRPRPPHRDPIPGPRLPAPPPRRVPGARRGPGGHVHPRAGPRRPELVRHLRGDGRRPRLRGGRQPSSTFTIQSISKPFVFGLALEDRGATRCWSGSASSRRATRSTRSSSTTATGRSTRWSTPAPSSRPASSTARDDEARMERIARRVARTSPAAGSQLDEAVFSPSARPAIATARSRT